MDHSWCGCAGDGALADAFRSVAPGGDAVFGFSVKFGEGDDVVCGGFWVEVANCVGEFAGAHYGHCGGAFADAHTLHHFYFKTLFQALLSEFFLQIGDEIAAGAAGVVVGCAFWATGAANIDF